MVRFSFLKGSSQHPMVFLHLAPMLELTAGAFPMRERGVKPAIREAD